MNMYVYIDYNEDMKVIKILTMTSISNTKNNHIKALFVIIYTHNLNYRYLIVIFRHRAMSLTSTKHFT